jgi:predicted HAD superfamily hydrolase
VVFNHQSLGRESKASLQNDFLKRQEFAISVSTLMLGQATYEATMFSLIGWRCLQFPGELDDDLKNVGIL